jgi:hypothetical protein
MEAIWSLIIKSLADNPRDIRTTVKSDKKRRCGFTHPSSAERAAM